MLAGGRSKNRGWLSEGVSRASMLSRTILPGDEELGKKDDDHKPGAATRLPSWTFLRTPLRWRRRRILLAVVALYLVYLFVHNVPDLGEFHGRGPGQRFVRPGASDLDDGDIDYDTEPTGPPKGQPRLRPGETPPQVYSGQLRFYRLASSLQSASNTGGYRLTNRNVLFAVSSLKSAATMLPMICEMSRWKRNWVHAAFLGRVDMPIDDILEINGIDKEKCPAFWHDARPDYMEWSTELRAEKSVATAMAHIQTYLHPQVAIMDDSLSEDPAFVRGLRSKCQALSIPIIEVPKDRWENFMWLTRLDTGSLKNWHKPTVDVLIQAPPESSGGIIRLLKSISKADYAGLKLPRLTIELPADIDQGVEQFLESFAWPPNVNDSPLGLSQLTIRRRIASHHSNQEEAAIRFLELFFPTTPAHSHVLMLSPNTELSSMYFHYLKYIILEFKYSSYSEEDAENIMGASLELPSTSLDGKSELKLPGTSDMHSDRYQKLFANVKSAPFLWQAPNSHAALYFGDKWVELHSFLSGRVKKHHQNPKAAARAKLVSETQPSWAEYMLEFMRARGYSLFYPSSASSEALVTIHNELYHLPAEYAPNAQEEPEDQYAPTDALNEPFLVADTPPVAPKYAEPTMIPHSRPLHLAMPFEGDLPEVPHLPYLLHSGEIIPPVNATLTASMYATKYRETVGGCTIPEGKRRKVESGRALDLFCFGDEDDDDWEELAGYGEEEEDVEVGMRRNEFTTATTQLISSTSLVTYSNTKVTATATATTSTQ